MRVPPTDARGPHYPVEVWGVIEDEQFTYDGKVKTFADVVSYWPALNIWTVTMACRADREAADVQVRVSLWQPLPPISLG